jgi:hypothetical protein
MDINYRNEISKRIKREVREGTDANTNLNSLIRNMWVNEEYQDRADQTKSAPKEAAEFKRQTKNSEYMAIPPEKLKTYRLQNL